MPYFKAIRARRRRSDEPLVVRTNELSALGLPAGTEIEIIPFRHRLRIYRVIIKGEHYFAEYCPHCTIKNKYFTIGGEIYALDEVDILYEVRITRRAPLKLVK